jgi:hypothetical protein
MKLGKTFLSVMRQWFFEGSKNIVKMRVAIFRKLSYNYGMSSITIPNPQQEQALSFYKNPNSDTFGNLKQSLLKAGFKESYVTSIYTDKPKWITDNVSNTVSMIQQAEKNLQEYTSEQIDKNDKSKANLDFMKIQLDASKFILKTLGRSKYNDNEDKADTQVQVNIVQYGADKPTIEVESK